MAGLVLAVRFLTVLPIAGRAAAGPRALGRAAWWFPVVGLALGALLAALDRALALVFPPLLASAMVVLGWKVATGGLHLDGLADCLDGLAGATPPARLAIMRDSRIGTFGAAGLALVLLVTTAALAELPARLRAPILILVPAIGRAGPALVAGSARAATPEHGAGADFIGAVPRTAGPVEVLVLGALAMFAVGPGGAIVTVAAAAVAVGWAVFMSSRLAGLNGDALGSTVELAEAAALVTAVALARHGIL